MDKVKVIRPGGHVPDEDILDIIKTTFSGGKFCLQVINNGFIQITNILPIGIEAFEKNYPPAQQQMIKERIKQHLATQRSMGETFQTYAIQVGDNKFYFIYQNKLNIHNINISYML